MYIVAEEKMSDGVYKWVALVFCKTEAEARWQQSAWLNQYLSTAVIEIPDVIARRIACTFTPVEAK
jgi:hypothetical protein